MSKSEVLYVKGMNLSESEEEEYVWDDRKLNDAYDKAIRIANAEVAKRVAMSTNTQTTSDSVKQNSSKKQTKPPPKSKGSKKIWKVGMPCRAIFDEDGLEYEAIILTIVNEKDCIVQFLGYNNLQMVPIETLNPSLDRQAQTRQVEKALLDRADDGFESQSPNVEDMEYSERASSPPSNEAYYQNRKKSGKQKNKKKPANSFTLPDIPMPDMSMLKNLGAMDMPLPPPPPLNLSRGEVVSEEQAVSSMLLSWYMSGYYTGLYQGMKRAKENRGEK